MQQWETSTKVATTALNSQGSAMREQAEYSKSLEARINRLQSSFSSLSMAMSDALLNDSLIGGLEAITNLTKNSENMIKTIGMLAPIMGTAGLAVGVFSGKIRGMAQSIIFAETQEKRMIATTRLLSATWKGFLASTGIGLAFAAVGFAVEKLISVMGKQHAKQEELERKQKELTQSYESGKDSINDLVDEYERLNDITNRTTEQDERYKQVQDEIANVLPTTTAYLEDKNKAHRSNVEAIKEEIKYYDQLSKKQAKSRIDSFSGNIDDIQGQLDNKRSQLDDLGKDISFTKGGGAEYVQI